MPYPQLKGHSNLLGNRKYFFISFLLEMMLDNNMFKCLDHCVSQTIQRRDSISGPFSLEAPTLPSELQCFGRVHLFVAVVVVVVVVICRNI